LAETMAEDRDASEASPGSSCRSDADHLNITLSSKMESSNAAQSWSTLLAAGNGLALAEP